ncbi:hypothetical protein [Hyphomonas johnsonii]|uniref:Transferase n=1 Tax=Hyphomonas johnsonii MHS-2 TaxID=1280950 RepID=A0A059FN54_9PROT|nr:hypothetical protein [Hyphomonas johnsonii]KCZ92105.1 transferase [Hyphomonas johnsonii MHS-2]
MRQELRIHNVETIAKTLKSLSFVGYLCANLGFALLFVMMVNAWDMRASTEGVQLNLLICSVAAIGYTFTFIAWKRNTIVWRIAAGAIFALMLALIWAIEVYFQDAIYSFYPSSILFFCAGALILLGHSWLSAKRIVVRTSSIILVLISISYIILTVAEAALWGMPVEGTPPSMIVLTLVSAPIVIYYTWRILAASRAVWSDAFARLSDTYESNPEAAPPVANFVPRYARKSHLVYRIIGGLCGAVAVFAIGFGIFVLYITPLSYEDLYYASFGPNDDALNSGGIYSGVTYSVVAILLLPLMVLATFPLRYVAYAIFRLDIDNILKSDNRAPTVYLRMFGDDKLRMNERFFSLSKFITQSYRVRRLDELLCEYAWYVGPVMAVQNPADPSLNTRGPVMEKMSQNGWQDRIEQLLDKANLVVLQLNLSDGVAWEFQKCLSQPVLSKTIFVFGLQKEDVRLKIVESFISHADIDATRIADPEKLIAARFLDNGWVLVFSGKRTKYDFLAALQALLNPALLKTR